MPRPAGPPRAIPPKPRRQRASGLERLDPAKRKRSGRHMTLYIKSAGQKRRSGYYPKGARARKKPAANRRLRKKQAVGRSVPVAQPQAANRRLRARGKQAVGRSAPSAAAPQVSPSARQQLEFDQAVDDAIGRPPAPDSLEEAMAAAAEPPGVASRRRTSSKPDIASTVLHGPPLRSLPGPPPSSTPPRPEEVTLSSANSACGRPRWKEVMLDQLVDAPSKGVLADLQDCFSPPARRAEPGDQGFIDLRDCPSSSSPSHEPARPIAEDECCCSSHCLDSPLSERSRSRSPSYRRARTNEICHVPQPGTPRSMFRPRSRSRECPSAPARRPKHGHAATLSD